MGTKSSVFEKMDFQLEHLEMEFEAETWWFWSTHGVPYFPALKGEGPPTIRINSIF